MQNLSQLMGITIPADLNCSNMSELERVQHFVDVDNSTIGSLHLKDGFNCERCLNRGHYWVVKEYNNTYIQEMNHCECREIRQSIHNTRESGMGDLLKHRLEHYQTTEEWQKRILDKATSYLKANSDSWFTIIGQSGAGKTMICSAIAYELLQRYRQVKFIAWTEFVEKLKRMKFDADREDYFTEYSRAEVLYIDDLFKGSLNYDDLGRLKVNQTDVKYAFQLLNERYNKRLVTIISSEFLIDDIKLNVDEAIAGRIKERSTNYCVQIKKDMNRNYRFRKEELI